MGCVSSCVRLIYTHGPSYTNRLVGMHFLCNLTIVFTSYAELQYLSQFSISETTYLSQLIDAPWFPPVALAVSSLCDRLRRCVTFSVVIQFNLIVPLVCAIVLGITYQDTLEPRTVVALLMLMECGPANTHTILDGNRGSHFNHTGIDVTIVCERARILGSMVGLLIGGYILHSTDIQTVLSIQAGFLFLMILIAASMYGDGKYSFQRYDTVRHRATMPEFDGGYDEPKDVTEEDLEFEVVDLETDNMTSTPPLVEEKIVQRKWWYCLVSCFVNDGNEPAEHIQFNRLLMILSMLPLAEQSIYYLVIGPLAMTTTDFGVISSVAILVEFGFTFLYRRFQFTIFQTGLLLVISVLVTQSMMLLIVSRVVAQYISSFSLLLVASCIGAAVKGLASVMYNTMIMETSTKGSETWYITLRKMYPKMGMLVRIPMDWMLTVYYEVDHDNFSKLIYYVSITALLATISSWYVLRIPSGVNHKHA